MDRVTHMPESMPGGAVRRHRGSRTSGYSAKTANEQGSRLLANVQVATAITEAKAKLSKTLEITAERVLAEVASIAFSPIEEMRAADKLVALEKLMKYLELYPSAKVDMSHRVHERELTDTELWQRILSVLVGASKEEAEREASERDPDFDPTRH